MYTTDTKIRPLIILEWIYLYIVLFFGLSSIILGCYFTFMTRHGKSRMFDERINENASESSEDDEFVGETMSATTQQSPEDVADVTVSSATSLIPIVVPATPLSSKHSAL
ncbi:hypothetical protein RB195_003090 [Necator americanus]|uniref:Uncharacterized protein n=1 Tax=Necator americanus TaxID=51031 RepID=A0ABR1DM26_NECAM